MKYTNFIDLILYRQINFTINTNIYNIIKIKNK